MTEYELAVQAQQGDHNATMALWNKYKPVSMSILKKVAHLTSEELESEVFMVFHHKLFDLFDPAKIGCKPENWTFSFMVVGGMKNLRSKLINQSKKYNSVMSGVYYTEQNDGDESAPQDRINYRLYGAAVHETYNPERLIIAAEDPVSSRVERFYAKLSAFEKAVLAERRAGFKLQQIADKFSCSLSKVKSHLRRAKEIASQEFEVMYA